MDSSLSRNQLRSARKRIILFTLLGILLTGALVGASTTIPMYKSARAHIEQANIINSKAHVAAIQNQLSQYHIIAEQLTSRTEIKKRLEAYVADDISLAELREFTQPRLQEPATQARHLAALIRYTNDGTIASAVGSLAEQLRRFDLTDTAFKTVMLEEPKSTKLIRIATPIYDQQQQQIGLDVLYFYTDAFTKLLGNIDIFGGKAELYLTNMDTGATLSFDYHSQEIHYRRLTEREKAFLLKTNTRQTTLLNHKDKQQDLTYVFSPFESHPLMLIIKVPTRTFYQAAYQDLQWAIASIVAMLLFGTLLGHIAITPLIRRLAKQADELKQNTIELRIAANVFEHTHEPIAISDANLTLMRANEGFYELLGIPNDTSLIGRNLLDYISPDSKQHSGYSTFLSAITKHNSWRGEIWYQSEADGRIISTPTLQSTTAVKNHNGEVEYFIHIFSDISEQKIIENQIKRQASIDTLTSLPNRGSMLFALKRAIHKCQPEKYCALLFMDLDGFKPVNDQHGHQIGDKLLRQVAQRLRSIVREGDFVGRYGGDEFLMIINQLPSKANSAARSQAIIEHLSAPYKIEHLEINIGVSIGIAHYPSEGLEAEKIIQAADEAMYRAKDAGRNRYSY